MDKVQIEKLWNVSNTLDEYLEHLVYSKDLRTEDIKKIQSIQEELDQVIEFINSKYLILS